MNKLRQVLCLWCVAAAGVVTIFALPGDGRFAQLTGSYLSNHWVRFCAYAALMSIPWATWRIRASVLCSVAVVLLVLCGLPHLIFRWPQESAENIIPQLFGTAAGVLFGLNVRVFRIPLGSVSRLRQERGRPARGAFIAKPVSGPTLTWGDTAEKEQA